jgi:hypothetical protein
MKRLFLLLSISSLGAAAFLPLRPLTDTHTSIILRLRGGESDGNNPPDKRRKKRRRSAKTAPDADTSVPADVSSDEMETSATGKNSLNDDVKSRRRRAFMTTMMFKGRSENGTSSDVPPGTKVDASKAAAKQSLKKKRKRRASDVSGNLGKVSEVDSSQKKKKRRKRMMTAVEPEERESYAFNDDASVGLDEKGDLDNTSTTVETVQKRRRIKRSSDTTNNIGVADKPPDEEKETIVGINAKHDEPSTDEDVKAKRKRKKRKSERPPLPSTEKETSIEMADSIHQVDTPERLDESLENEENSLLLASDAMIEVQEIILEGDAPSNQSVYSDTNIEEHNVVVQSEANDDLDTNRYQSSAEAAVSIDAAIEIPGEEIVPESIFSSVEVDDSLAVSGVERQQIDTSDRTEELPVIVQMSANNSAETGSSHLDLADGATSTESQSDIFDQNEREDFELQLLKVSVESAIEIPSEEVVPESISSTIAIDESVHGAEIEENDLEGVEMSAETAANQQEQAGVDKSLSDKDMEEVDEKVGVEDEGRDKAEVNGENSFNDNGEIVGPSNGENDSEVLHNEEEDKEARATILDDDTVERQPILHSLSDGATVDMPLEKEEAIETNAQANSVTHENTSDGAFPADTDVDELSTFPEGIVTDSTEISVTEASNDADKECFTLSVVTWNLGEAPPSEREASFIRQFRHESDLVMIGAQECEDIKPRRSEGHRSRHLRRLGILMLGEKYVPIAIHSLGGIQMALYCRREKLDDVEFIGLADVTCGVGNVFHNKGAIGVYLKLKHRIKDSDYAKSSKVLLVTSHLAAHVKNVDARNDDFRRIMTELEAQAPARFLRPKKSRDGSPMQGDGSYLLDSMDHVIFSGDLNYRVALPRAYVDRCIYDIKACQLEDQLATEESDMILNKLLRRDQLLRTISAGRAFVNFNEGKISFLPTFKFDKGSTDYDTSYKQRIPAWTDRILFKSNSMRVLKYDSVPNAMHSDHRPVFGTFSLGWGSAVQTEKKPKRKTSRR